MAFLWPNLPSFRDVRPTVKRRRATENIGQSIELWPETAREFGDPIPEPKSERLMLE